MRSTKWKHTHQQHSQQRHHQCQTIVNNVDLRKVWDIQKDTVIASLPKRDSSCLKGRHNEHGRREKWNLWLELTTFWKSVQTLRTCFLLSVWLLNIQRRDIMEETLWKDTRGTQPTGPCVFVFYMSAGCRWVQAGGLTPLDTHRTSPLIMGPRRHNLAAKPCWCRFGCRYVILVFGRCVCPELGMSHSACSSAWTRGNPGNSVCRSKTAAGLAGVWWVHSSSVVVMCV